MNLANPQAKEGSLVMRVLSLHVMATLGVTFMLSM
jgi:hypothetical protein